MQRFLKQQLDCSCIRVCTSSDIANSKVFSLEEADDLISRVILKQASECVSLYDRTVKNFVGQDKTKLDEQLSDIKKRWDDFSMRLGAVPEGIGILDFNAGHGRQFCWKYYPEADLRHESNILWWHWSGDGFLRRLPICSFSHAAPATNTNNVLVIH